MTPFAFCDYLLLGIWSHSISARVLKFLNLTHALLNVRDSFFVLCFILESFLQNEAWNIPENVL